VVRAGLVHVGVVHVGLVHVGVVRAGLVQVHGRVAPGARRLARPGAPPFVTRCTGQCHRYETFRESCHSTMPVSWEPVRSFQ
jgi:hypothetical protein